MSLLEVLVVIAIVLALTAVLIPSARSLLTVNQRSAARKLAIQLERFHDEAMMRNRSFRIVYYIDEGRYVIEAGEAGALISATPEDRENYEKEVRGKLEHMDEQEQRDWKHNNRQPFESLEAAGKMEVVLPKGVKFGGVYTPQYGKMILPGTKLEGQKEKDETPLAVFSYIMNSGFSEHTVIWLVDADDPDSGWTVEVEPLSGAVRVHGELVDPETDFDFIPETPPSLPN